MLDCLKIQPEPNIEVFSLWLCIFQTIGVKPVDLSGQLSLEQKFKLKVLQEQVQDLSKEEAQQYLLEMFRQMMVKDNLVKNLLRNA